MVRLDVLSANNIHENRSKHDYKIMKGDLEENWERRIANSTVKMKERINLTFHLINID